MQPWGRDDDDDDEEQDEYEDEFEDEDEEEDEEHERQPPLYAAVDSGSVTEARRVYAALVKVHGKGDAARRRIHAPGGDEPVSPLAHAAKEGDPRMIAALGEMEPFLDEPDVILLRAGVYGLTPLGVAAALGRAENVEALLAIGCDPCARLGNNCQWAPGGTALHAAVSGLARPYLLARTVEDSEGPADRCVEVLLEAIAPVAATDEGDDDDGEQEQAPPAGPRGGVNVRDNKGATALMLALRFRRMGAAGLLLDHGADAGLEDDAGRSALAYLLERTSGLVPPSMQPSDRERAEMTCRLVAAGCRGPAVEFNHEGTCALFLAARRGCVDTLRALLSAAPRSARAVARARSPRNGRTALHYGAGVGAVGGGADPAAHVRVLLESGADATVADNEGRVPAFAAVAARRAGALRLLLDATPPTNPSAASNDGTTLLMSALSAGMGFNNCAKLLLARGADAKATRLVGQSQSNSRAESAADIVLRDYSSGRSGWTPASFSAAMAALMRAGAPIDPRYAQLAMTVVPEALRQTEPVRQELERRRTLRQRTLGQEDVAGLAMDFFELREAEEAVRRREARVAELERALGVGGGGGDDEQEEEAGGMGE